MVRTAALVCTMAGALVACTSANEPMVNRMGVSDAQYDRDLADCKQRSGSIPGFSNPIATCLSGKGYQILMGK